MMRRKNKYGQTTASTCFICGGIGTTKNNDGLTVCSKCKDKTITINCPVCQSELETKTGKFGDYFYCWKCNVNWSKYKLEKFNG